METDKPKTMMPAVFDRNLFEVSRVEDIPLDAFVDAMVRTTFAVIRGLVSAESMYQAHERIVQRFDRRLDAPTRGHTAEAVRSNFQKLLVGGESCAASNDDARLFRAFYNPIWMEDIWGMRSAFVQLARTRNKLVGEPLDFAIERIESNGLWTAARFHQYPRGGGFFRRHTDYVVKEVADEKSMRFYQLVLTMSRKGEHFSQGGAFVDIAGQRLCLDDVAEMGDIVVYDGRTMHGVEDIDPTALLDMNTMNGRISGLATLFKKM